MNDKYLTINQIIEKLRDGDIRAAELLERSVEAYERADNGAQAFIAWDPEAARLQALAADAAFAAGRVTGPLQGIPVSVKDLYGLPGYRTHAGTPQPLPGEWEAAGPVVNAVRRQLATIVGKTHTVEFAFGGMGLNPHWQTPINPWDANGHRIPGGSSSGAGVSIATGTSLVALGTDTAGSVRVPASVTGTVGLKTTAGRWSLDGIVPLSPTLDTPGVLTRSVADAATAFEAIDPVPGARTIRPPALSDIAIGTIDTLVWDGCSPGVAEAVEAALGDLTGAGARRKNIRIPSISEADDLFRRGGVAAPELFAFLRRDLPDWIDLIAPIVGQRIGDSETMTAAEFLDRMNAIRTMQAAAPEQMSGIDVLAWPTVAFSPPRIEEIEAVSAYRGANLLTLRNTALINFLGLCAITIPVGLDALGMPVGLQLAAPPMQEERLLSVALAVEKCLGHAHERIGKPPRIA